jgi:drug/metabolite transporter (DMT)-like permease
LYNVRALTAFAAILVIWGLNYIFVALGLLYSPPLWLAVLRASLGFAGALALLYAFNIKGSLDIRQKVVAFLTGIVGVSFFFGFWLIGETTVPAGETSVFIYTFPIWTLFLSIPVLGDRPSLVKVGAAFLGFAGVGLVAKVGTVNWTDNSVAMILLLVAGFSWALDTVLFKWLFEGEQMLRANVWQLAGGLVFLLAWAFITEPIEAIHWTLELVGAVVWIGLLGTAMVYVLWFTLLSRYNVASFTAYASLVVVVALIGSVLILKETINAMQLGGVFALIASIYLINKTDRRKVPKSVITKPDYKKEEKTVNEQEE